MIKLKDILLKEAPGDPPAKDPSITDPPATEKEEDPTVTYDIVNPQDPSTSVMLDTFVIEVDKETGETETGYEHGQYRGSSSSRRKRLNWWKIKGIDTRGVNSKIRRFATFYIQWMDQTIGQAIGPVVTSGYRGPKRQIPAMWNNWVSDNTYVLRTYRSDGPVFQGKRIGKVIDQIFKKFKDNPAKAKRRAIDYLQSEEDKGFIISRHQQRGAIDIALFDPVSSPDNENLHKFLQDAESKGIIDSFLDERDEGAPHFHIALKT